MSNPVFGHLDAVPALTRPDLLAAPVAAAIEAIGLDALVAAIDPEHADTETLCATYGVPMDASANAVVVRGTRAGVEKHAVCMTLATHRVDVNGLVRRRLDARKASFAPMDYAVEATGMEYGGINPVGAPADWPVWVDGAVADTTWLCIGSGIRGSKLFLTAASLLSLPNAERVDGLARPAA
ncbi:MAG: YbaK/EbsC family protein [Propioniciclava sp.]|uniref:YbaK/EbsC family protein n=1 Tax=Propioniciclava sp. TaxID=2038686 RepID=UPI0039E2E8D9